MTGFTLAIGVVVVGGLLALNWLATRVGRPRRWLPPESITEAGLDLESFEVRSGDATLATWLLSGRGGPKDPLVVIVHGWGASHGTALLLARPLVERGRDVLLFDVRGHGRSGFAPYVTVRHFREDVVAVLDFGRRRFPGRRVVLVGHSFGGAAGVLAGAEHAALDGLVLIAAPADVLTVTADFLTDHGMPGGLLVWILRPFWWLRLGGTFGPLTPSRRIGEVRVPILMIQPENDQRVHRGHADRLSEAAGVEYHIIEGREHTDVLGDHRTVDLVDAFLERIGRADPI